MSRAMGEQRIEITTLPHNKPVKVLPAQENKIYVRSVKGAIETLRRQTGLVFLALFFVLPWITYGGNQAILFDFGAQRFHLFSVTLWPQDLTLLAWIFIIAAFALFFVTALWGRVWCGFMCPQTVFTFLFVWIEEKVEGARNKRIHLDKQAMSRQKLIKKSMKHLLWAAIATFTALSFIGYFMPVRQLMADFFSFDLAFWPAFFVAFFALCTYGNAGWMREVMCTHMCPYSRFQSAMFDNNTVTVTYDNQRGEGRGPRAKSLPEAVYKQQGLGDCIDCSLCVQVCPTGIDIRNGLQYECINCGACVDACNGVMTKMGYKKDLISFTSSNALEGKAASLLRPKIVGYFAVLIIMLCAFTFELINRSALDLDVVRDRNTLYRETFSGSIENVYTLVVMNKSQQKQVVSISTQGLNSPVIHGNTQVDVEAGQLVRHPIAIEVNRDTLSDPVTSFSIVVSNSEGETAESKSTFIMAF